METFLKIKEMAKNLDTEKWDSQIVKKLKEMETVVITITGEKIIKIYTIIIAKILIIKLKK